MGTRELREVGAIDGMERWVGRDIKAKQEVKGN